MEKQNSLSLYAIIIILIIPGFIIFSMLNLVSGYKYSCSIKTAFNEDKYCKKVYYSNVTTEIPTYIIASHSQDKIDDENRLARMLQEEERRAEQKRCYDSRKEYNLSFDIKIDYGYSCNQIKYINDHFIDNYEKRDAGYIKGGYSGFLSHGHIEGKSYQYVNERVSATGMLIERLEYGIDCNNETVDEHIDYYDTGEFVMYYVEECLS